MKQSGLVVKALEKSKVTYAFADNDCEEEESKSEKDKFEELVGFTRSEGAMPLALSDSKQAFPALHFSYKKYLNSPVSPPPDAV